MLIGMLGSEGSDWPHRFY